MECFSLTYQNYYFELHKINNFSMSRDRCRFFASRIVVYAVANAFIIPPLQLTARNRGPAGVALARQIAMYLVHVVLGLSYTHAGLMFGRDRTTVAHACRLVEELRDDSDFDCRLDALERALRIYAVNCIRSYTKDN